MPPKGKVRALVWSDSQTLLTVVSVTIEPSKATEHPRENFLTIAHTVDGGDGMMLPAGPPGLLGANLVRLSNKPHTVIMSSLNVCKNKENCLIAVDTVTGHFEIVKNGNEHTIAWVVDHNGNPVAREDWDSSNSYRIYALVGSGIKELLRKDDSERPTLVGLLPDESALVLLATNGRPHESAWALPLDGTPARLIAEDPDADITGVYTDPNGGAVIGVYLSGAKNAVKWLDPVAQHRDEVLQRSFPGKIVRVYVGRRTVARPSSTLPRQRPLRSTISSISPSIAPTSLRSSIPTWLISLWANSRRSATKRATVRIYLRISRHLPIRRRDHFPWSCCHMVDPTRVITRNSTGSCNSWHRAVTPSCNRNTEDRPALANHSRGLDFVNGAV